MADMNALARLIGAGIILIGIREILQPQGANGHGRGNTGDRRAPACRISRVT